MRPQILFTLFADVASLPGVGAKIKKLLEKVAGAYVVDVLYHLPVAVVDRRNMPDIMQMEQGSVVTAIVRVEEVIAPTRVRDVSLPYKVRCYNETGFLTLVFFKAYPDYLAKQLPVGEVRVVSGKIERFGAEVQMVHPDYIVSVPELESVCKIEPVYAMTAGLAKKNLLKIVDAVLQRVPDLPEWIDSQMLQKKGWKSWRDSILRAHRIVDVDDLEPKGVIRERLAYDEMFANQVALSLLREYVNERCGVAMKGDGHLCHALLACLPFELTKGQKLVLEEIRQDQESSSCMVRLLQGDVGSGKTVVALLVALRAVEAGKQVAVMAPTEILAKQHYRWMCEVLDGLACVVGLMVGKLGAADKRDLLGGLESGEINIVVGTHALFQDSVMFNDLGLVIIDEQHRFGVKQRGALIDKGDHVDVLLMTATPIPRTLTMTLYGDMECSRLLDKPVGRKEIDTRIIPFSKIASIVGGMQRVVDRGEKVYWICPLIEESHKSDLAAAEERYAILSRTFGDRVGLVHGRMSGEDRAEVMMQFRDGDVDVLVATTVIEVGVDVPLATVIVIEHAERFGLSQLHQLRGRVGRNDMQSSCVLLYHELGDEARERLKIMRDSNDGFKLAEEDLRLRGGGDVLGTKQSGLPDFKVADLYHHFDLLCEAHKDARDMIRLDPQLKTQRGQAVKVLLHLFRYEAQLGLLSGEHKNYARVG